MNSSSDTIREKRSARQLPRVVWWVIWAVVILVVYYGVIDPSLVLAEKWNLQADRIAAAARAGRQPVVVADQLLDSLDAGTSGGNLDYARRLAEARLGPAIMPGRTGEQETQFDRAIEELLKRHEVEDVLLRTRSPQVLSRGSAPDIAGTQAEIRKVVLEVRFVSTPETLTKVLADMEKSPLVVAVGKVQITRIPDTTRVKCILTPETWIQVPKTNRH